MLKDFLKNLKTKDWALVIMTILLIVFSGHFFLSSSGYKSKIKNLHHINDSLNVEKTKLSKKIEELKDSAKAYRDNITSLQTKIDNSEKDLQKKNSEISKTKQDLDRFKKDYEKNKSEIKKLEENPIKRVGNDLLNSLKEKTK